MRLIPSQANKSKFSQFPAATAKESAKGYTENVRIQVGKDVTREGHSYVYPGQRPWSHLELGGLKRDPQHGLQGFSGSGCLTFPSPEKGECTKN